MSQLKNQTTMPAMKLSGLEPFNVTADLGFVNIGERTNDRLRGFRIGAALDQPVRQARLDVL